MGLLETLTARILGHIIETRGDEVLWQSVVSVTKLLLSAMVK